MMNTRPASAPIHTSPDTSPMTAGSRAARTPSSRRRNSIAGCRCPRASTRAASLGGWSDDVIAARREDGVAQPRRARGIQALDSERGALVARGPDHERRQAEQALDRAAQQVDVLQPRDRDRLLLVEQDARAHAQQVGVDREAPALI